MRDVNRIDNLVAIAMTTEVIASKIHKAYRLRETDVLSISLIYTNYLNAQSGLPQLVVVIVTLSIYSVQSTL